MNDDQSNVDMIEAKDGNHEQKCITSGLNPAEHHSSRDAGGKGGGGGLPLGMGSRQARVSMPAPSSTTCLGPPGAFRNSQMQLSQNLVRQAIMLYWYFLLFPPEAASPSCCHACIKDPWLDTSAAPSTLGCISYSTRPHLLISV